ncbi:2-hydroxyacid dehydrogenase [Pseudodonghicola flavimaris]|uniref:Glyoxylate/hydroxypyruvate reductase A n=1 Tax=Pseudodonghicola flavimaris TaxID=3050036 RepID=A0ABT7EWP7_9RHOB|nr:glyoxylate/hydroxypyruvate reductase A [Pseudodonghicola flavimaris]MDK3016758.1 glyoxylate/hydroxypyruvate reductase A [Pseudodonghicola flavimaris]
MTDMSGRFPIPVVALSSVFDLAGRLGEADHPEIRLLRPEEIDDPASIEVALAWAPTENAFAAYPNLRLVSSIAAGVDSILACPSLPQDAVVVRIRDEEQALMMAGFAAWSVVWCHRHMGTYVENQKTRSWDREFRPVLPSQVTVGVLGFGLMGRACARAIAAMGYRVVAARRSDGAGEPGVELISGPDAPQRVAAQSQIVVNVLPLTEETRDLLDRDFFALMPEGASLVQIGRGEHLVEADFLAALDEGRIASAVMDVFRQEPLPEDHPFWGRPEILITPHKASDTTRSEILRQLAENFAALTEGMAPPGAVDRGAGY